MEILASTKRPSKVLFVAIQRTAFLATLHTIVRAPVVEHTGITVRVQSEVLLFRLLSETVPMLTLHVLGRSMRRKCTA